MTKLSNSKQVPLDLVKMDSKNELSAPIKTASSIRVAVTQGASFLHPNPLIGSVVVWALLHLMVHVYM